MQTMKGRNNEGSRSLATTFGLSVQQASTGMPHGTLGAVREGLLFWRQGGGRVRLADPNPHELSDSTRVRTKHEDHGEFAFPTGIMMMGVLHQTPLRHRIRRDPVPHLAVIGAFIDSSFPDDSHGSIGKWWTAAKRLPWEARSDEDEQ